MYQALYRKYRPKTFEEVVGQDVIVKTLKNSIKNNMVSHAYLLSGPRGTGKTSIAKIFAKVLNCYEPVDFEPCNKCISCEQANQNQNIDIIEIDAASNNGVDEIREIRNKITLVPTNSKYKIYIIDEVHMLTTQAFNALLKTLEEPPSHIIFIFATTEPQKIPQTILSRCQRFDYKKVSEEKLVERLRYICDQEKINISEKALFEIARLSDGGVRDSISLLDQSLAYSDNEITIQDIHDINGTILPEEIEKFIINILEKNLVEVISDIEKYDSEGKNIIKIVQEVILRMKDIVLFLNAPNLIDQKDKFYQKIKEIGNYNSVYSIIKVLSKLIGEMKTTSNNKILLEIELIKNIELSDTSTDVILSNTEKKESNITNSIKTNVEKESGKVTESVEIKENVIDNEKLQKLKQIRVNNSLCKFSQKEREKIKKQLTTLNEYVADEKLGKYVSIIMDGELKAASDNNLMFMYKSSLMAESFNLELLNIQKLIEEKIDLNYKVIAIDSNDWEYIKNDYNSNKEKYKYQKEDIDENEIFNEKKIKKNEAKNSIDEMFNDIIEYE